MATLVGDSTIRQEFPNPLEKVKQLAGMNLTSYFGVYVGDCLTSKLDVISSAAFYSGKVATLYAGHGGCRYEAEAINNAVARLLCNHMKTLAMAPEEAISREDMDKLALLATTFNFTQRVKDLISDLRDLRFRDAAIQTRERAEKKYGLTRDEQGRLCLAQ
jgi:hypothetical protein